MIEAFFGQQLIVRAFFHDLALIDHHHRICIADGAQAVGNDEAGAPLHQLEQGFLNARFGAGIHAACRLIQNQDGWIGQDGAGDRKELALPLAEVAGTLAQVRLVSLGKLADEVIRIGHFGRPDAFFIGGIQPSVADVLHHRVCKQKSILQHQPQLPGAGPPCEYCEYPCRRW